MSIKHIAAEPVPVGSYIATAFRVVGYDRDVDGTSLARLEHVDRDGQATGWDVDMIGLRDRSDVLLDDPGDLREAT